jgi:hypothetical protein
MGVARGSLVRGFYVSSMGKNPGKQVMIHGQTRCLLQRLIVFVIFVRPKDERQTVSFMQ